MMMMIRISTAAAVIEHEHCFLRFLDSRVSARKRYLGVGFRHGVGRCSLNLG